ncbi:alpha-glucuronidase family glycosyl hydrolase [Brevundimonas sp.]|uniref:alpha-glucuronidase family glycosyl hydrolase n=1 Tax=Brevundimonas sp. TaxID=1871086 RepID=UPI001D2C0BA8|nr:alpha-glucuronidase family glycosyl hydrolase [Brevundimonas sp.]MBA4001196.1 alpha-glucuronidase [Brevundimonas sp.]
MTRALLAAMIAAALFLTTAWAAKAEDGYDLWLRYPAVEAGAATDYRVAATQLVVAGDSPTLGVAVDELERGLSGLLGAAPERARAVSRDGALLVGRAGDAAITALGLDVSGLDAEGYVIRNVDVDGHAATVIAGGGDAGALYGAFHFLRLIQTRQALTDLDIREAPAVNLRLLNHWDNLDRTVERGYAGQSLWDWHKLPDHLDPRYTDYARANASIGINGTVINNVNTDALSLTAPWLEKAAALAGVFRPYGIRVYLSARFSAPVEIGGLDTADPLDPRVQAWWRTKADEISALIPDFGGFLVKANSEGQPGPQDYGRNHADGANMLADAVAPHGGVVMWRAFVYSDAEPTDRAMQAYDEFVPLDGQFRDNVIVQVKNGPIDFQPREPFHPLFGATPETPLMMEFQITKEYLGFATHLAYLGPLYEEVLDADTHVRGPGSTVAEVVDGSLFGHRLTGMAGVANTGSDRNWSGSQFDQANWYVFGRMAWDPGVGAEAVAREWAAMTFTPDPAFVEAVTAMMIGSREAVVDYMTPLGLNHLMATGHHYGPGPWVDDLPRADWNPTYFHRADADGIGFDRTASGSDAVSQYAPAAAARFADPAQIDERFLLWFHHLPWDHPMPSGRPLWHELVARYDRGVAATGAMRRTWAGLTDHVDARRHREVADFLAIQESEARWWRDSSIAYWRSLNGLPIPEGHASPEHDLAHYESLSFPHAPGHWD